MFLPLFPMRLLWLQVMLSALCLSELHSLALVLVFSVVLSTSADVKLLTSIKGRGQPIIPPVSLFLLFFEQEVFLLKKMLLIIPLIISMVISSLCFTAYADITETDTGLPEYYYDRDEIEDILLNDLNRSPTEYFYVKVFNSSNWGSDQWVEYYQSYYIYPFENDTVTGSESNGVYTFTSSGKFQAVNAYSYCYYSYNNPNYKDFRNKSYQLLSNQPQTITFDSNTGTISLGENLITHGSNSSIILEVDFNMDGMTYNPDALNVLVEFNPDLSGSIDRSISDSYGNIGYSQNLFMTVTNNCNYPIQYRMSITKKNQTTHRGLDNSPSVTYDDDEVFVYYSNDWVYTTPYDNRGDYWSGDYSRQLKPTSYHFVSAGQSDEVKFDYSQINLEEGTEYICTVVAIRADYDIASEINTQVGVTEDRLYTELKQVDYLSYQTVYSSEFSMLQYSDVHFDVTNSSHGVVPYGGYDYFKRYSMSRLAIDNGNGDIDYTNKNVYDDSNSWYNNQDTYRYDYDNSYSHSSGSSPTYTTLLSNCSSVFSFFGGVLAYFPYEFRAVFNLGLWSMIVILIIRRLH